MFQTIVQSVKMALATLLRNKTGSFLTMLGIIIGVGAVIIIMAMGAGAQSLILAQVESLGTNLISVVPGYSEEEGPFASMMGFVVTTLTYDDAIALRQKANVPDLVEVVAYTKGFGTVTWYSQSYDTSLTGTTASYLGAEKGHLQIGRFFSEEEEKNLSRVTVLGSAVKKELFGESQALGEHIKIKKQTFEVIGVMEERGTVAMEDYDDQIFLPIKTMQKLMGVNHIGLIRAKVDQEKNLEYAMRDITVTLRQRHDIDDQSGRSDDFTVSSSVETLDMIKSITDALKYFLAAMAALSLIVGGIGIMNIMLISVTERTQEIGLRKAVGADNIKILSQFLMESIIITLIGGCFGIALGIIVSFLLAVAIQFMGYDWNFIISPMSVFLAVIVSCAVGIFFGFYPAKKASQLNPIEALRYE